MSERRRAEQRVIEAVHDCWNAWYEGGEIPLGPLLDRYEALLGLKLPQPRSVPYVVDQLTSQQAAESMRSMVGALNGDIMREFLTVDGTGLTADGVQARLRGTHQTISARVSELSRMGWLVDTGQRRPTRTGRLAIVYRATAAARTASQDVPEWNW